MRITIAALAVSLLAAPAFAQKGHNAPPPPDEEEGSREPGEAPDSFSEKFVDTLKEKLELRDDQVKKVKSIAEKSRAEREKINADLKSLLQKRKAALQRTREDIRTVLDLDQKERFDEMFARMKMRHRGEGGGARMRGGRRGERGERGPGAGGPGGAGAPGAPAGAGGRLPGGMGAPPEGGPAGGGPPPGDE